MSFDHQQINDFRSRVLAKEEVTEEELKGAIEYLANLRQGVASSGPAPAAKKKTPSKTKAKAKADAEAALGDLLL